MAKLAGIESLQTGAEEVARLLKTMSHANRLLIACQLASGEKSVGEIEAATGVPQPYLSRELARLREAGLVRARRKSKNVFYRIADRRLTTLVAALCAAMGSFGGARRRKQGDRRHAAGR